MTTTNNTPSSMPDDPHTLDDLADLFLTGAGQQDDAPKPPPSPADDNDWNELEGPPPIKLQPKAQGQPGSPGWNPNDSNDPATHHAEEAFEAFEAFIRREMDDGPNLRLTNADDEPSDDQPDPPSDDQGDDDGSGGDREPAYALAEAVLLGNLPGMAGPWLTQYAQLLSQQDGAVVILHVNPDSIDLELVEPTDLNPADPGRPSAKPSARIPPRSAGRADLIDLLNTLVRARVAPVRTVLVHLDADPATLSRLLDFEYWTLLSGADDAAIVAGYRMLKQLLESDETVASARVGLMVVGSDEDTGRAAARKLRSAAANFLHAPLELIGFQQKMIPARCQTLGSYDDLDQLWPRLSQWIADLQPPTTSDAQPDQDDPDQGITEHQTSDEAQPQPSRPYPADLITSPIEVKPPRKAADAIGGLTNDPPSPQAKQPDAPTPGRADFSPHDAPLKPRAEKRSAQAPDTVSITHPSKDTFEIDLLSFIDTAPQTTASIPGGIALEARCPAQPQTQLALDDAGRLHLLHRHDESLGDPPTPREAIVELVAVRDWARQHRQLLQLTERGRTFDPDADPVLHLFTDRADQSVHLVARLGELLKLHLLREVKVGDHQTLFCTPLSA